MTLSASQIQSKWPGGAGEMSAPALSLLEGIPARILKAFRAPRMSRPAGRQPYHLCHRIPPSSGWQMSSTVPIILECPSSVHYSSAPKKHHERTGQVQWGTLCPQMDGQDTQPCFSGIQWLQVAAPWLHLLRVPARVGEVLIGHQPHAPNI